MQQRNVGNFGWEQSLSQIRSKKLEEPLICGISYNEGKTELRQAAKRLDD
jgi:hypothetical protein